MEVIYKKCCGVDVHKKVLAVCLISGNKKEARTYGTSTKEIMALVDWYYAGLAQAKAHDII